jgi:hypothetical protein
MLIQPTLLRFQPCLSCGGHASAGKAAGSVICSVRSVGNIRFVNRAANFLGSRFFGPQFSG